MTSGEVKLNPLSRLRSSDDDDDDDDDDWGRDEQWFLNPLKPLSFS